MDLFDFVWGVIFFGIGGGGDFYIGKMFVECVLGEGSIMIFDLDDFVDDFFVILIV